MNEARKGGLKKFESIEATRAEVANCQVLYAALAVRDGRADAAFHTHAARVVAARDSIYFKPDINRREWLQPLKA